MPHILIAHRGNVDGPKPELENTIPYIEAALAQGFDVEVDVWLWKHKMWLGHDKPEHEIEWDFLKNPHIWVHAKEGDGLYCMQQDGGIHCFYIGDTGMTFTSNGMIYGYPEAGLPAGSIAICIEPQSLDESILGVCTDYPLTYRTGGDAFVHRSKYDLS